jgi:hypothetical protein
MGSVGGKTPTEPKVYSSLILGILSKIKLMLTPDMGDRIRQ